MHLYHEWFVSPWTLGWIKRPVTSSAEGGRSPRINRAIERIEPRNPNFRSPITNITNGRAVSRFWSFLFFETPRAHADTVTCRWFTSTRCGRTHQFAVPILRLIGHRSVIRSGDVARDGYTYVCVCVSMYLWEAVSIYTHYPKRFRSHTLLDTRVTCSL